MENYYFIFGKMSKIGQQSITVSPSVNIEITDKTIVVKGQKGQMSITVPHFLAIARDGDILTVTRQNDSKRQKASHGLYRSLIANAVFGVEKEWEKQIEVVGTGFNVKPQGSGIVLKLGLSHVIDFQPPKEVKITVEGNNIIIVSGADKQQVGEVAQQIKSIKKSDPYKGKGLRYKGEVIKLKPGKKAKTTA